MSELIMTIGLPGSGKSTWAASQEGYEVFSSDAIRHELGDINDQSQNHKVFKILHDRITSALSDGKNCIYDATNITSKNRRSFLSGLKVDCHKVARVFVRPFNVIREQNEARSRTVPPEVIKRMLYQWQTPIKQEGFDEIVLDSEPCHWDIYDMEQDTEHHTLSLVDHLGAARDNLSKLCDDKDMILAALLHDIGKYWTKSFIDSKGYPTLNAHYYNHENVGAYMCLLGAGNDRAINVSGLITWHMRPFVWDEHPNVKERDRKWMGDSFIRELEIIHKADLEAK